MSAFNFKGLTPRQQELLTFQGWHAGSKLVKQPQRRTVQALIGRGLVTESTRQIGLVTITEYSVPINVHAAWCAWCAESGALSA